MRNKVTFSIITMYCFDQKIKQNETWLEYYYFYCPIVYTVNMATNNNG